MTLGPVTIRSVLFALTKRGLLTDEELQSMDAQWRQYRSKHHLDGHGRKRAEQTRCSEPGDGAPVDNRGSVAPGTDLERWQQKGKR